MAIDIFPAIDLRKGRVVRLQLGDPELETVFSDDPAAIAKRWVHDGAGWLHVVNLDGAFAEDGRANWGALTDIVNAAGGAGVQFGGGVRTLDDVTASFDAGVSRVVLGTTALENPQLVAQAIVRFGPAMIAAGIDARDGFVRTRGWRTTTAVTPAQAAISMREQGVTTIIFTDINRDGILAGVNARASAELAAIAGVDVIASGGVRGEEDIDQLMAIAPLAAPGRVVGVIIGRALYDGRINLVQAINKARA